MSERYYSLPCWRVSNSVHARESIVIFEPVVRPGEPSSLPNPPTWRGIVTNQRNVDISVAHQRLQRSLYRAGSRTPTEGRVHHYARPLLEGKDPGRFFPAQAPGPLTGRRRTKR